MSSADNKNLPPIKIACVVGARPNFIKMAALTHEIERRPRCSYELIHTGQHFSPEMSQQFFDELSLPKPHHHLGIGSGSQTQQTAAIMQAIEPVFEQMRPDLTLVVGDVNSTLAATLTAVKLNIPVAHVEAGLRSGDRRMPEEINRILTDSVSDYLFASEQSGLDNLRAEGVAEERLFLVGNVMIDTLLRFRDRARQSSVLSDLGLDAGAYAVTTLHRPSNVDDPSQLKSLIEVLTEISRQTPVVFPVHPRTRQKIESSGVRTEDLLLTPPLGYLDFLQLTANARLVLTDSGGIQEETTILGVPCLTLRENTERPVTIHQGTNRLVGVEPAAILSAAREALENPPATSLKPKLWDAKASSRILDVLEDRL